jgi:hypothetical protein
MDEPSGADDHGCTSTTSEPREPNMPAENDRPTSGKGVDIGAGEPTTFEPEEDPDAVDQPVTGAGHGHVRTGAETDVDDAAGGADDPSR